jgi:hypothetical protein
LDRPQTVELLGIDDQAKDGDQRYVHALSPPERARTPNARALVEFLVALFRRAA